MKPNVLSQNAMKARNRDLYIGLSKCWEVHNNNQFTLLLSSHKRLQYTLFTSVGLMQQHTNPVPNQNLLLLMRIIQILWRCITGSQNFGVHEPLKNVFFSKSSSHVSMWNGKSLTQKGFSRLFVLIVFKGQNNFSTFH